MDGQRIAKIVLNVISNAEETCDVQNEMGVGKSEETMGLTLERIRIMMMMKNKIYKINAESTKPLSYSEKQSSAVLRLVLTTAAQWG